MTISRSSTRNVFRIMPDRRQVTLEVKTGEGSFSSYTLYNARRKPSQGDLAAIGGAAVKQQTCVWQLWQADLDQAGAPAPKAGDRIKEGTTRWAVQSDGGLDNKLIRNVWDLPCVKVPA